MYYGKYDLKTILEDDAILPVFKGSTFRGVFGVALKKVLCALKRQECPQCLLRERCVYSLVFETPSVLGKPSPPHPFVIEPPLSEQIEYTRNAEVEFSLILFGWANDYLPYFIYAFEEMGKIGLGRKIAGKRPGFHLQTVSFLGRSIYRAEEKKLVSASPSDLTLEELFYTEDKGAKAVRVRLLTPLRLKFQNRLHDDLPFHILTRAMLRRLSSLMNTYGSGEPQIDYKGLVARAEKVHTVTSNIRWVD